MYMLVDIGLKFLQNSHTLQWTQTFYSSLKIWSQLPLKPIDYLKDIPEDHRIRVWAKVHSQSLRDEFMGVWPSSRTILRGGLRYTSCVNFDYANIFPQRWLENAHCRLLVWFLVYGMHLLWSSSFLSLKVRERKEGGTLGTLDQYPYHFFLKRTKNWPLDLKRTLLQQ